MFFSSINQFTDLLSCSQFIDDEIRLKVDVKLKSDNCVCFFLFFMYQAGLSFLPSGDLILRKNEINSIKDKVNSEYIEKLKRETACFLNSLARNWIETERKGFELTISTPIKKIETSTFLMQISEIYNLEILTTLKALNRGVDVKGEINEVLRFSRILRWEAIQTHSVTLQAIHLLMCAKKSDECFSSTHIPKELTEKIVELISHLLVPNPIQNP